MPIPSFDRFGLLPGGIHECTIKEVEVDLAWNDERRRLTGLLQGTSKNQEFHTYRGLQKKRLAAPKVLINCRSK